MTTPRILPVAAIPAGALAVSCYVQPSPLPVEVASESWAYVGERGGELPGQGRSRVWRIAPEARYAAFRRS